MEMKFNEIKLGGRFTFCGQMFSRIASDIAEDAEKITHVFDQETVVECQNDPDEESPQEMAVPVARLILLT